MNNDEPLTDDELLADVRRLWPTCQYHSGSISGHLIHKGRRIERQDVWHVLKTTRAAVGKPRRGGDNNDWTYAVSGYDLDGRQLRVVVQFVQEPPLPDKRLIVISAYEED